LQDPYILLGAEVTDSNHTAPWQIQAPSLPPKKGKKEYDLSAQCLPQVLAACHLTMARHVPHLWFPPLRLPHLPSLFRPSLGFATSKEPMPALCFRRNTANRPPSQIRERVLHNFCPSEKRPGPLSPLSDGHCTSENACPAPLPACQFMEDAPAPLPINLWGVRSCG